MQQREAFSLPGVVGVVIVLAAQGAAIAAFMWNIVVGVLVELTTVALATGFTIVAPNHARVVTFLGRYLGTVRTNGPRYTVPLTRHRDVSLRVQNFDSDALKVNDAMGNPVEVAAVVVWRVVDTAKAVFDVEDYQNFVRIQTETAVRHMASQYPYDTYQDGQKSLQANADEVTATLHAELQSHLDQAGVQVIRTQLRRLAYAPEIAGEMLRRQQAEAVVAARQRIVEGAVGMVDDALELLSQRHIVELDEERKASMVSNLLVVLCSESRTQPVVNTGTLYQ
jgi:regulator of protease activity HflC (stomatin/prohibitin superfamily)